MTLNGAFLALPIDRNELSTVVLMLCFVDTLPGRLMNSPVISSNDADN
jgi:hypothetical protein